MTTWFVSRHQGAIDWALQQGVDIDRQVDHLQLADVRPGDIVIGTLPVELAAEVCARGARYYHLSVRVPRELRGKELTADQIRALDGRLQEFAVQRTSSAEGVRTGAAQSGATVLTFVGLGRHDETSYYWCGRPEATVRSTHAGIAAAILCDASHVVFLSTAEAWRSQGDHLQKQLTRHLPRASHAVVIVDDGQTPQELWRLFPLLHREIASAAGEDVLLDVTHGFRTLPLFAAAVAGYHRSVAQPAKFVTLCYAAWECRDAGNRTPIWDVTAFMELAEWSRSIGEFLRTGRADSLVGQVAELGRLSSRQWAMEAATGPRPQLPAFARALQRFADDLAGVRVGALLHGCDRGARGAPRFEAPSARQLAEALEAARTEITAAIPPLEPVLDSLADQLARLTNGNLAESGADQAMAELAALYLNVTRYPEAAVVLREAWVSRYADSPAARVPSRSFDAEARQRAEQAWMTSDSGARSLAKLRNDLLHGGFNADPLPAQKIREQLLAFLQRFREPGGETAMD